jgi:nicotinamidase-related amidase
MALSFVDPKTALIVIDLQKGVVTLPTAHPIGEVVKHAVALLEAFCRRQLPVVLVNVDAAAPGRTEQTRRVGAFPAGWADLLPELNRQPQDYLVTKRTWGTFTNTELHAHLKGLGVTRWWWSASPPAPVWNRPLVKPTNWAST